MTRFGGSPAADRQSQGKQLTEPPGVLDLWIADHASGQAAVWEFGGGRFASSVLRTIESSVSA